MKKTNLILGFSIAVLICACNTNKNATTSVELTSRKDTISYIIGADIAGNLIQNSIEINQKAFMQGISDKFDKDEILFTDEQMKEILISFQQELQIKQQEKMDSEAKLNKEAGEKFLEMNKKNENVKVTDSGLQYSVIKEGDGKKPGATSEVTVHYEGKLINGNVFDSSYERGAPATFRLNQVIPGWTEGLQLMSEGSIYELVISSELGYGDRTMQTIPAGSTLIFKVELISVN